MTADPVATPALPTRRWRVPGGLVIAVALTALVLAISGGAAVAAKHHYLITSTKQIKPGVVKKLQGAKGPQGATGPAGPNGAIAGYFAAANTAVVVTNQANVSVLTKALPAGSYVIHADANVFGQAGAGQLGSAIQCALQAGSVSQTRQFSAASNPRDDNVVQGSLSFDVATTASAPVTITVKCTDYSGVNGAQANGSGDPGSLSVTGALTAVQTTSNS